jgi:hypothetical protein
MLFIQNSSLSAIGDQAIMNVRSDMSIRELCFKIKNSTMITSFIHGPVIMKNDTSSSTNSVSNACALWKTVPHLHGCP